VVLINTEKTLSSDYVPRLNRFEDIAFVNRLLHKSAPPIATLKVNTWCYRACLLKSGGCAKQRTRQGTRGRFQDLVEGCVEGAVDGAVGGGAEGAEGAGGAGGAEDGRMEEVSDVMGDTLPPLVEEGVSDVDDLMKWLRGKFNAKKRGGKKGGDGRKNKNKKQKGTGGRGEMGNERDGWGSDSSGNEGNVRGGGSIGGDSDDCSDGQRSTDEEDDLGPTGDDEMTYVCVRVCPCVAVCGRVWPCEVMY
jgi:hypothetical protein